MTQLCQPLELSRRLQALVDWIQKDIIADIGCDHAYVVCQAVLENKASKGYACDIAQGPLNHACQTIAACQLQSQVIPRLAAGLENLPADVEQVIIAGMGGRTMVEILEKGPVRPYKALLSPHGDAAYLRQWLIAHGFQIERERVLQEEGHWYFIMDVSSKAEKLSPLTPFEMEYGRHMQKDAAWRCFIQAQIEKWEKLMVRIPEPKKSQIRQRVADLYQALEEPVS